VPEFDETLKGAARDSRLREALIAWLSTARPDGRLHTVPVWFLWTGEEVLITAEPGSVKIRNLRANPRLTLAIDGSRGGHEAVMLEGSAEIGSIGDAGNHLAAYFEKYCASLAAMQWSAEELRETHRALIRVRDIRFIEF
jgi:PPOX class probable F420-dependent enzyme